MHSSVTRYVLTYVNREGQRTLMLPAQGRRTFATAAEAQAYLSAILNTETNSAETLRSVWGDNPRCEVRPVECWPVHHDPKAVWFDL